MAGQSESTTPLVENAIDSLRLGLKFHLHGDFETSDKHAILNVFHAVELLLKARLATVHPSLIYKSIDAPIGDKSRTVGLNEMINRLPNLGIEIDSDDFRVLQNLRKRRNRIEHHRYDADDAHHAIIGKALRFICRFLPEQLGVSLADHLDPDLFEDVERVILDYNARLAEAEVRARNATDPLTKDDLIEPRVAIPCPECGNTTLVFDTEHGDYCFFCRREPAMFMERPYERPSHTYSLPNPSPEEHQTEVGDEVKLYLSNDDTHEPIWAELTELGDDGKMVGVIRRPNRHEARGDQRFRTGKILRFSEKNIISFRKA